MDNQFIKFIDTYIENYSIYDTGKVLFESTYGEIIFYRNNSNTLIVHGIYIYPIYRNKGFCRNILYYLIDKGSQKFKYLCIQSVISKILYEYLLRFEYKNKKFAVKKTGFVYKL
jgi:hypothetical protein